MGDVNLDMRADMYVLEDLCSDVDVDVRTGICFTKKKNDSLAWRMLMFYVLMFYYCLYY